MAAQCDTCIFRPGNPMHLEQGRLAELVEANRAAGAALICHKTLPYGDHPEMGQAVCRGYYDAFADECPAIQLMKRMFGPDVFEEVVVP